MSDRQFEMLIATLAEQTHWLQRIAEKLDTIDDLIRAESARNVQGSEPAGSEK